MNVITIDRKILEKNDAIAAANRERLTALDILSINLVSSPGAGKTSLLERTLERLDPAIRVSVVEGDVQTDIDAQRVARYDVPVIQIVTHGGCHLEAGLVRDALGALPLEETDLLFIENVGNLVCPAGFDLGEDLKAVVLSVTEGDDKPLKYPAMFARARVLILNKIDLLPHIPSDLARLRANALRINPDLLVFETSCTTGQGIDAWCAWLTEEVTSSR